MITCPWCGTNYPTFQPNCQNCGGPLPPPQETRLPEEGPVMPPPAPRPIASNYAWKLLLSDGWAISALVFLILGFVFTLLGIILTVAIITAFVGIPFAGLGILFLGGGIGVAIWRYKEKQAVVDILRVGEATTGQITSVEENYNVRVNGRNPWRISYQFALGGQTYGGELSTLNTPGAALQPGKQTCILYLPQSPARNTLYPHP